MTVEYDLVVIGASAAGIAAAKTAARYHARVALIQQGETDNPLPACLSLLQQRAQTYRAETDAAPDFHQIAQLLQLLTLQQQAIDSFDRLASLGIDVIPNSGAFYRKPRLGFAVADRGLSARAYLVAMSLTEPTQRAWSIAEFPDRLAQLPQINHLLILGASPESVALAQALVRLGKHVTLVEPGITLLADQPTIDPTLAYYLQTQLEADGVRILTQCHATPLAQTSGQAALAIAGQTITADALLHGKPDRRLNTAKLDPDALNLGVAKVRWNQQQVLVDRCSRAARQVYVCQPSLPQHNRLAWEKQAIAATHHALKLPWGPKPDSPAMITVLTNPELVAIGLTEAQAQQQYGQHFYVLQQPLNHLLKAQVLGQPTGLCKLIVRSNGTLVGAHLLGPQAVEWSTVLAFAIQQKLKITMLADMLLPSPTLAEILQQTASNYRFQVRRSELWRYSLEEFFAWRRYWAQ